MAPRRRERSGTTVARAFSSLVTALALFIPGRRALRREIGGERREQALGQPPVWRRLWLVLIIYLIVLGLIELGLQRLGIASQVRFAVYFLVALLVTPFAWFWFLLIPGIIALVAWFIVYTAAYDIGFGQAFAAGLVQVALGLLVDYLLRPYVYVR